jgi:hypothetical protein
MTAFLSPAAILLGGISLAPFVGDEGAGIPPEGPGSFRSLALDLLGRPPYSVESERWQGMTRQAVCAEILAGEEFWQNWLEEQLYFFLLIDNFRPETEGVTALPGELATGKLGVIEALHRVCLSSSFDRRNPGPDTFVTVVMEQLLGLTVQKSPRELEIGKKLYDGGQGKFLGSTGGSQADVVNIAVADQRAPRFFLAREYERLLRRAAPPKELEAWARELGSDPKSYASIVARWLASPEYDQRLARRDPLPNRLFVRALFVDLVGRLPDSEEGQRIRSALDGMADARPLRSLVARLLLDSGKVPLPERAEIPDPRAWITATFQRLLGRAVEPAELAEFEAAFKDPACRPATVLYAIVSHPEYQTW